MRPGPSVLLLALIIALATITGCTDETVELKQKIAELEKKIEKQQKSFGEFVGRFSPPKDFSADIQRIEDQQDRVSQVLKTQVEPINSRLEEFRDWAQDAQKEREDVRLKIKNHGDSVKEMQKVVLANKKALARLAKDSAIMRKKFRDVAKNLDAMSKAVAQVRKEVLDNNTKLVAAVRKALPKVRDSAVEKLKGRLAPLEKRIDGLTSGVQNDRKAIAALRQQPPPASAGKEVQNLTRKVSELEEILATQKAYLLELGAKVHQLESQYK